MPTRPKTAVAGMKIRLREPLRARLEGEAKRKRISLNKELVARVEQSFTKDDAITEAFGGPDLRKVAMLMASAFAINGGRTAEEKSLDRWTNDPDCYLAGMLGVVGALMMHAPRPLSSLDVAALESRIRTQFVNMGGKTDAR
jgi:hypothetical protein